MEKREAPWGVRPGEERSARIDAFAKGRGISRHAALLLLLDSGLDAEEGGAAKKSSKVAPAPVAKPVATKSAGAPKSANQQAQELAERRAAEARRTAGWFTPKGRK